MKLVLAFILIISCMPVFSQRIIPNLARVGGKGIFVFTGERISDPKGPVSAYKIERKAKNDADFQVVAVLNAAKDMAEFKRNLIQSDALLPYKQDLSDFKIDSIWMIGKRSGQLASLRTVGYSLPVLAGFNMIWLDQKVVPGEIYQYRVSAIGQTYSGLSEPVQFSQRSPVSPIRYEKGIYNQPQGNMQLYWVASGKDKPVHMEAYRSENGSSYIKAPASVSFFPRRDTFQYLVKDTTAVSGRMYNYYVKSYDGLGNLAPFSDTISIASLDYIQMPLPRQIKTETDSLAKGIKIGWNLPSAPLLQQLTLFRSDNSTSGFKAVAQLSVDQNSYVDQDVVPSRAYFYYFEALYKTQTKPKRTTHFAGSFIDNSVPITPQNVRATGTRSGVHISWEHEGRNITGFWLYRAQRGRPLQLINTMIAANDTSSLYSFVDSDSSLNGSRFYEYAVKSISTSHIESYYSDTVVARPLMNVPVPQPPMRVKLSSDGNRLLLFWDDVSAYDELVSGYMLIRSTVIPGTKEKYKQDTVFCAVNLYTDTLIRAGNRYAYTVKTLSVDGTQSRPSATVTSDVDVVIPASPASLTANRTRKGVLLQWTNPDRGDQLRYSVYRYVRGSKAVKVGEVKSGLEQWIDVSAKKGQQYFYYVTTISELNKESTKSNEAVVSL